MKKLITVDADTLMTTPMPAIRYVVDQLLPQGLHILAGAPKVGKSWLALWLCLCVSKGESVWGFSTAQSPVLYLCLEDSYTRINSHRVGWSSIHFLMPPMVFFLLNEWHLPLCASCRNGKTRRSPRPGS